MIVNNRFWRLTDISLKASHGALDELRRFVFAGKEKTVTKPSKFVHQIALTSLNEPSTWQLHFGVLVSVNLLTKHS